LDGRTPVPVDDDVGRVLDEWEKHRAGKKTLYAEFIRGIDDQAFRTKRRQTGSLRYRHPNLGRLDIKADEKGWGREVILGTKANEFWHATAADSKLFIHEFGQPWLFEFVQSSQFVWMAPARRKTLQKHGAITKVSEDANTIVLQVKPVSANDDFAKEYQHLVVHLRKSDYLPVRLVVRETQFTEITWEFTTIVEDLELNDSDFVPPKLDLSKWTVTRQSIAAAKPRLQLPIPDASAANRVEIRMSGGGGDKEKRVIQDARTIERFLQFLRAHNEGWRKPWDTFPIPQYTISIRRDDDVLLSVFLASGWIGGRERNEGASDNRLRSLSTTEQSELFQILNLTRD